MQPAALEVNVADPQPGGLAPTGWLIVALGAACIAVKETWEIVERLEWPSWSFVVLLIVSFAAAVLYSPLRTRHDQRMMRRKAAVDAATAVD